MKKIALVLAALLLLSACGNTEVKTSKSSRFDDSLSAGSFPAPSPAPSSPTPTATPTPAPTPTPTPTPEPTPTPTPEPRFSSLREQWPEEYTLWVDGIEVKGILQNNAVLVNAGELSELWSWFQWEGNDREWTFSGEESSGQRLSCRAPEDFSGDECVHFQGKAEEYWLPVSWLCGQFSPWLLWDTEYGCAYITSIPWIGGAALHGHTLPVLMYHEVAENTWGIASLFVRPENMRAQLQYLQDNGYDPIFFSDISHIDDYDKPVLLTFDDGYAGNYTNLLPLLREFGMKATVFVITGMLGDENYLTAEQVKEMSDSGLVDIQSHTVDHYELATLSREDQDYQLRQSQLDIARITKRIPYVLSYPSGSYNDTTVSIGQSYYTFGIKMNGGKWTIEGDYFYVDRLYVSRSTTLDGFASLLS